jgi:SPP1 family predicted phage head-tail adaptor
MSSGGNTFSNNQKLGAGQFDRYIAIQQPIKTPDGKGGFKITGWENVSGCGRVPAYIRPLSGSERFKAQQVFPGVNYEVRIRYRPSQNIDASMRAVYGARIFNIREVVVPEEAFTQIKMRCEELQAKGSNK